MEQKLAKIAIRRTAGLFYYPWAINRHDIGNTIIEAKNRKPAIDEYCFNCLKRHRKQSQSKRI